MAGDSPSVYYGKVDVAGPAAGGAGAQILSASASPDELVGIASRIWRRVRDSGVDPRDDGGNDGLLDQLRSEFRDFAVSFPIVLRMMVQVRQFHVSVFRQYLKTHHRARWETREKFLESQAAYVSSLYRREHAHIEQKRVMEYRQEIYRQLLEEDQEFVEMEKEAKAEVEAQTREIEQDRRQRLYTLLMAKKAANEEAAAHPPPPSSVGGRMRRHCRFHPGDLPGKGREGRGEEDAAPEDADGGV